MKPKVFKFGHSAYNQALEAPRKSYYIQTIFLNQDKGSYVRDKKIFLSKINFCVLRRIFQYFLDLLSTRLNLERNTNNSIQ